MWHRYGQKVVAAVGRKAGGDPRDRAAAEEVGAVVVAIAVALAVGAT